MFTGLGISLSTASILRMGLIITCSALLCIVAWRRVLKFMTKENNR
jgi:hypothetical protein